MRAFTSQKGPGNYHHRHEKKTAKKPKIGTETTFITKDGTIQVSQNIVQTQTQTLAPTLVQPTRG